METPYQVLLYYFYNHFPDPEAYRKEHIELCERLELLGRILIGNEGINGTVSGTPENCDAYREYMDNHPLTKGLEWKVDNVEKHQFPRLSIKVREEIVPLGLKESDFSPRECTGEYLNPTQWREMLDKDDTVIIDARNQYEWELGHFEGALLPEVDNFRELTEWVRNNKEDWEGKKVMTYCTGGIRCEKFSGFLKKEGLEDVYQLHGGIVTYGKDPETKGEKWKGSCYVFDERIKVPVNRTDNAEVISTCIHCGKLSERYINCTWSPCNERHFCCEECEKETKGYCCHACYEAFLGSFASNALVE